MHLKTSKMNENNSLSVWERKRNESALKIWN